ncbi:G4 quadruplex nucleic acid binding protein [Pichia californica]|nr:G4 quadruplex nucleic acid binding protein [[Candida] californica]
MSLSKEQQQASISQWESLAPHIEDHIKELNETLKFNTFIAGTSKASDADLKVFKSIFSLAKSTLIKDISSNRHILRWIDLLQNTIEGLTDSKLIIDLNTELNREIKEKPKKKESTANVEDSKKKNVEDASSTKKQSQPPKGKPTDPEAIAKAKAEKEAKKAAKAKLREQQEAAEKAAQVPPNPSLIDLRVGFIEKAIKHPDADSLYVSTIQMGDEDGKPRTVCSGLVKHFSLEEMQQRYVIVVANLKPVTMRGIKSCAMVLCAASPEGKVEFVNPPTGSKAGDKIFFEGFDGTPEKVLNPKKKIWEAVQPSWTTTSDFVVVYKQDGKPDAKLVNKNGEICKCTTIANAEVR